ncbi:MAG: 50S ribosomal protein L11 methyltransferase [Saprospiraceae bacterium]
MKKQTYYLIDVMGADEVEIEILSAFLSDIPDLIGVTELGNKTSFCFVTQSSSQCGLRILKSLNPSLSYHCGIQEIENWNKIWEDNFNPVIIDDFCAIIAPHHELISRIKHCIIINPEMSFGTGHHETTFMMIAYLREVDVKSKEVLDFGCGTGILSILAEKENASNIDAVDYDILCIDSTLQNAKTNNCARINVWKGEASSIDNQYNLVLANVNRAVLLRSASLLSKALLPKGELILSGVLKNDFDLVNDAYTHLLSFVDMKQKGEWLAIRYKRNQYFKKSELGA